MDAGTQEEFSLNEVLEHVVEKIGTENLSFYHPSRDWVIEEPKSEEISEKNEPPFGWFFWWKNFF